MSSRFVKNSRCIQRVLLNQLKPEFIPKELHGLEMQALELTQMLSRTIEDGENSLVLVEGRRGSGKSILTRHVLDKLQKNNEKMVVVDVNGYNFTTDHAALKHLNERIANSMLAESEGLEKNRVSNTVAANIVNQQFFQRTLQDLYREGATVIIVLEQFEAFARQSRQSMLYNILDLTQHQDTRMAVICITRQINSAQRLEKRIRSRFDLSRQIILSRTSPSVDVLEKILKARLTIPKNTMGVDENCRVQFNRAAATAVEGCKSRLVECRRFGLDIRWLFTCVSIAVSKLHQSAEQLSHIAVITLLTEPHSSCSNTGTASNDSQTVPKLLASMLSESMKTDIPGRSLDSIDVLEGLTEPAVTLLIAFKRLRDRTYSDTSSFYNFKMAMDEIRRYRSSVSAAIVLPKFSEKSMLEAFMQLLRLGLIVVARDEPTGDALLPFVAVSLVVDITGKRLTKMISECSNKYRGIWTSAVLKFNAQKGTS